MDNTINSTFEIDYSDGKFTVFGISKATQKYVIEIIGERLQRGDGAIVYSLDDFSIRTDVLKSGKENLSEDEIITFIYNFFINFINHIQGEGEQQIVFNIKMDKAIPLNLYQRVLDKLRDAFYIDEGRINSSDNTLLLICN